MKWTISNLRTSRGTDGEAYSGNLLLDGRQAASFVQDGRGGETTVYWKDRQAEQQLGRLLSTMPAEACGMCDECERHEACSMPLDPDQTMFIARLVDDHQTMAMLKRQCAKHTLFCAPGEPCVPVNHRFSYQKLNEPFTDRVRDSLRRKYGEAVVIINEAVAAGRLPWEAA